MSKSSAERFGILQLIIMCLMIAAVVAIASPSLLKALFRLPDLGFYLVVIPVFGVFGLRINWECECKNCKIFKIPIAWGFGVLFICSISAALGFFLAKLEFVNELGNRLGSLSGLFFFLVFGANALTVIGYVCLPFNFNKCERHKTAKEPA